ncbi:Na+/H+ antiporter subunit E [Rhizobiales bacterium RZME27]|jgi:multicomponent K+:H+ antiporter subunit E|uniref:Na+/H+ antiporter subunit E n=1 Tax=Endobacterium cereale TaxID=2663029 RepID=A0A6A8AGX4_9HYPH|nr:Na+/H+ antiporter subunit E [Endobacterium cereale]MEB2847490.1 Na+/H+ antiporter subunit E [Endobacterium cereale]MQY48051.1 Na+/H+ antiporter subunit E [Endobacterium cereale]
MLPYPLLTLSLILMWLLLSGFTPGQFILGTLVAVFASWAMASLRPDKPKIRKWHLLPKLVTIVFLDIIRSNLAVAYVLLFGRKRGQRSGFLAIPLEIEDRTALSVLAIILTSTPGSAWLEYDPHDRTVLLHVLDLQNEDEWIDLVKNRYEKLLMEIFA